MDCKEAEGLLAPYLLGALDSSDMLRLDRHFDTCAACGDRMRQEGDIASELAYAVPQLEAPPRVKQLLFARIDAEAVAERSVAILGVWRTLLAGLGKKLSTQWGLAAAGVLIGVVALSGFWMSNRLSTIDDLKAALVAQMETAAEEEAEMQERAKNQRVLISMMTKSPTLVRALSGTKEAEQAQGFIIIESTGTSAVLSATGLRPLPNGKVYHVWLVENGIPYDTGIFTVDSTGYGITTIELYAPIEELNAVMITVDDTGVSVLRGDL